MKVGDLVKPGRGYDIRGVDYGIGLIIGETEHSRGLIDRKGYIVEWQHEHQWWDDEELDLYVTSECNSS